MSGDPENVGRTLTARQWRQIALITLGAVALYVGFRVLPTGTNLNHIDFRTGASPGSLEMCDPSNPQFIPVVAVRSPVSMTVTTTTAETPSGGKNESAQAGREARCVVRLLTASGKPIGPQDLLVAHTRKLHLLIVDPTLVDYQHIHPEPGERAGEWLFAFTPSRAGVYRVFADFTPVATGRGLYASADVEVAAAGMVNAQVKEHLASLVAGGSEQRHGDFIFSLTAADAPLRAGKQAELAFTLARADGGDVVLRPVMDAYAHLVAFDEARSGFAHLHPNEADLTHAPDARRPRLTFKITIPRAGRYVIWSQVNLGGTETFVPFWVEVQ
jgi:hypothetical protein